MIRSRPAAVSAVVILAVGLVLAPSHAQPGGKKYAVLVGVKAYDHSKLKPLDYPENDVDDLAALLAKHGYAVTLLSDAAGAKEDRLAPTLANIDARLGEVLRRCKRDDTVLVALAGHGLQFEKQKPTDPDDAYFCPRDARPLPTERDTLLSLKGLYQKLDESGAGVKLLLVDACRDDPTPGRGRGVDGSTSPRPPRGVAALFSCSAGERAFENDSLKHGVFFHYVLEGLRGKAKDADGDVTWDDLQKYVRTRVSRDVAGLMKSDVRQTPTLNAGELAGLPPVLVSLSGGVQVGDGNTFTSKTTGMQFVRVKAGTFTMGSPKDEKGRSDDETAHEVTLTKDYFLGVYEVTRGEFRTFVDDNGYRTEAETDGEGGHGFDPDTGKLDGRKVKYNWKSTGFSQTDSHPVVNVTWSDAARYAAWLSKKDGREYRLPTEAEWEHACRGGSAARYSFGDDEEDSARYGNVADASGKAVFSDWNTIRSDDGYVFTAPAGRFRANKLGLHDMHGNVWEWCGDWKGDYPTGRVTDPTGPATGSGRVNRGGGWFDPPGFCRSALRYGDDPSFRFSNLGFRLALVPTGK